MVHKKKFRSDGRKPQARNVTDNKLTQEKISQKTRERVNANADRHIFENSMKKVKDPKLRFDYSFNILSMRGDWESRIKVITVYFPFIVRRNKCKKFEELVRQAFESTFLV